MDTSNNILENIRCFFPAPPKDIRTISPLKLAYLGDAVFELIIRTLALDASDKPVKTLNKISSSFVNAGSQAELAAAMLPRLTGEEAAVFRRGRNAKASSVARHADIRDYRMATGLEALYGYLYLTEQTGRAAELLNYAITETGMFL